MRTWLKNIRMKKNLSQTKVAMLCGVSRQYYNFIENNTRTPSWTLAQKIADILEFDWTLFFPNKKDDVRQRKQAN